MLVGLLKTPVCCPRRPVCGVAGIPSSQGSAQHHMQHSASAAALPHCSHAGGAGSALAYRAQMDSSPAILMPSGLQSPPTQEQNGILDWLRKLRLHKYYPVFKQLTMEKVYWVPSYVLPLIFVGNLFFLTSVLEMSWVSKPYGCEKHTA